MNKQRKQIRLKNYDYSQSGLYIVTICTQNRECLFGNIAVGVGRDRPTHMKLNEFGKIVKNVWESLPDHHPVELATFQIMPNHVHFILHIISGASRRAPTTLGTIVGLFKSECTKQIRRFVNNPELRVWQRNYYEHIIRTENDLEKIRNYIMENPKMWERDRNNPLNAKRKLSDED